MWSETSEEECERGWKPPVGTGVPGAALRQLTLGALLARAFGLGRLRGRFLLGGGLLLGGRCRLAFPAAKYLLPVLSVLLRGTDP